MPAHTHEHLGVSTWPICPLELYNVFSSETFRCKKRFFAKRLGSVTDYCKRLASKTKRFTHRAAAQHIISTARRAPRPDRARGGRGGYAGCASCSNFSAVRSMSSSALLRTVPVYVAVPRGARAKITVRDRYAPARGRYARDRFENV